MKISNSIFGRVRQGLPLRVRGFELIPSLGLGMFKMHMSHNLTLRKEGYMREYIGDDYGAY